ncbi:MAG: hypothetical protein M0C28_07055 [Candidatus Moduliflexus flocculans]|nr:hypothetical protein [Candidatus Moduliflexus flocculans]
MSTPEKPVHDYAEIAQERPILPLPPQIHPRRPPDRPPAGLPDRPRWSSRRRSRPTI